MFACRSQLQRRSFLCLTAALFLLSGNGCGESSAPADPAANLRKQLEIALDNYHNPATAQPTAGDRPRIALVMKSLANEFFATMAEGARTHADQHAADYQLIVNGIQDETDLAGQVSLVEQMVAQQVSAIVIAPADSKALVSVLRKASEAGIVVVNIDNRLDADVLREQQVQIPFVGPDNRAGARNVGLELAKVLQAGDEIAILEGLETSFNGQQRKLGFTEAATAAGLKVVASQSAQWEMEIANQTTAALLTAHPGLRAIMACNDSMALGALAAVRAAGRNEVKIAGFDNIGAVRQAVLDGQIAVTADQHGDQLAVYGIETALELLRGERQAADVKDRETAVDLITRETLSR
jgi:ribose transport system substrate-binding protein